MSRTRLTQRLHKKLPIWANRLKAVMLNNNGLVSQKRGKKRSDCWTSQVNHIALANQRPEFRETRLPDYRKRERAIAKLCRWRLRDQNNLKRVPVARSAQLS
jgi:hypothetical protein